MQILNKLMQSEWDDMVYAAGQENGNNPYFPARRPDLLIPYADDRHQGIMEDLLREGAEMQARIESSDLLPADVCERVRRVLALHAGAMILSMQFGRSADYSRMRQDCWGGTSAKAGPLAVLFAYAWRPSVQGKIRDGGWYHFSLNDIHDYPWRLATTMSNQNVKQ